jgi:hypothetical protein
MPKTLCLALAAACLATGALAAGPAQAADRQFCQDYARAAVNQVRAADSHRRCEWRTDNNPTRWSPDWREHFEWCRGVSRAEAGDERMARKRALEHCAGGRDHDHDRYRDRY